MSSFATPSRAEHAVDLAAASIPAIAAGWSAVTLAPLSQIPVGPAASAAGLTAFAIGYGLMRLSGRREIAFAVPEFDAVDAGPRRIRTFSPPAFEDELLLDVPLIESDAGNADWSENEQSADIRMQFAARAVPEEADALLLEEPVAEGSATIPADQEDYERRVEQLSELILDDPLIAPPSDSRVVRLFAPQPIPTPGEMVKDIVRHLDRRNTSASPASPDASDALNEALYSLRDTLRRA